MAGKLQLSVIIPAQDQASAALANVEKQFGGVAQRMTASAENVGAGRGRSSLRVFRVPHAGGVAPPLGGLTAVAGLGAKAWIHSRNGLIPAAKAQEDLRQAADRLDLGGL